MMFREAHVCACYVRVLTLPKVYLIPNISHLSAWCVVCIFPNAPSTQKLYNYHQLLVSFQWHSKWLVESVQANRLCSKMLCSTSPREEPFHRNSFMRISVRAYLFVFLYVKENKYIILYTPHFVLFSVCVLPIAKCPPQKKLECAHIIVKNLLRRLRKFKTHNILDSFQAFPSFKQQRKQIENVIKGWNAKAVAGQASKKKYGG